MTLLSDSHIVFPYIAQFIVSCPDTNPKLPVNTLPKLAIDPSDPYPTDTVKFVFKREELKVDGVPLFVAFFNGITIQFADLSDDDTAVVPGGLGNGKVEDHEAAGGLAGLEPGFSQKR